MNSVVKLQIKLFLQGTGWSSQWAFRDGSK